MNQLDQLLQQHDESLEHLHRQIDASMPGPDHPCWASPQRRFAAPPAGPNVIDQALGSKAGQAILETC